MAAQPSKYSLNLTVSDHTTTTSTLSHYHLLPELLDSLLTGPAASTLDSLYNPFSVSSQNHLKSLSIATCLLSTLQGLPMKTITMAYKALHNLAPACPSNHSFCCPPSLYLLLTVAFLFFLVHARQVNVSHPCIHCSLVEMLFPLIVTLRASFFHSDAIHSNVTCCLWNSFWIHWLLAFSILPSPIIFLSCI